MRRTKEDAEKTRQQLMDAGLVVFIKKGYQAANLEDIAKEANVTRGAITWHFKNKKTLYRAIIEEGSKKTKLMFNDLANNYIEPQEMIEAMLNILISERHRKHLEINMLNNLLKEKPAEFIDLVELVQSYLTFVIGKLADAIESGIKKGIFKKHLNPDFTSKAFFTFLTGFFTDFETLYHNYSENEIKDNIIGFFNEILLV